MKKRGNTKCWPKCWPKILTQLVEVWSDTTSLQNYLAILNKDERMRFHSYYTPNSNMYICLPKDVDKDVYSSTIYNTAALETTQCLSTVVVQLLSHVQLPATSWTAVRLASLSFTISQNLRICSISCPLSGWYHPTILSSVIPFSSCPQSFQHQGLFQWVSSSHQVAKVFSLLYGPTLTSVHDYWKNHSFDFIWTFVGKVMSLLFNMLSRVVIAFFPRSKHLLMRMNNYNPIPQHE